MSIIDELKNVGAEFEKLPYYEKYQYLIQSLEDRMDKELESNNTKGEELVKKYNNELSAIIKEWQSEINRYYASLFISHVYLYKIILKDTQTNVFVKTSLNIKEANALISMYMNTYGGKLDIDDFNDWCKKNNLPALIVDVDHINTLMVL